jgi:hypothetical protein
LAKWARRLRAPAAPSRPYSTTCTAGNLPGGEAASEECRKSLEGQPSPEVRRRLEALVRQQDDKAWDLSADKLRTLRALEVLELAATPEAWELLTKLAKGLPSAWQTREVQGALERLRRRQPTRRIMEFRSTAMPQARAKD